MKVYRAISAVQSELATVGIGKDRKNEQQGYKFRGIDDVYNELAPFLAKHSLCILPRGLSREVVERLNAKGTALFYVNVAMEFDFVSAEDGSKHTIGPMYGEAMDSGDKATNKAMSAAYKYACMQAFCIPTEGDNDTENQTHEVQPRHAPPPPAQAPAAASTVEPSKAQIELLNELGEWCNGDAAMMAEALDELSRYKEGPSGALDLKSLEKGNSNEKFQKWVGATLGKLRKRRQMDEDIPF